MHGTRLAHLGPHQCAVRAVQDSLTPLANLLEVVLGPGHVIAQYSRELAVANMSAAARQAQQDAERKVQVRLVQVYSSASTGFYNAGCTRLRLLIQSP